jgi:hypothetical protein
MHKRHFIRAATALALAVTLGHAAAQDNSFKIGLILPIRLHGQATRGSRTPVPGAERRHGRGQEGRTHSQGRHRRA